MPLKQQLGSMRSQNCSRCWLPKENEKQTYCNSCQAEYMREKRSLQVSIKKELLKEILPYLPNDLCDKIKKLLGNNN